jgi:hypothetical protein
MLWIFNKNLLKNNIIFYQVFENKNYYNDNNNIIYNLECNELNNNLLKDLQNLKINFEIKILGNIIMYKNLYDNEILTFTKKETCEVSDNLVLKYEYQLIDNHRLPELTSYDYHYIDLEFDIYYEGTNIEDISNTNDDNNNNYDKLFIIQNNKSNNSSTNYWIYKNL